jgi:hypothetical protein
VKSLEAYGQWAGLRRVFGHGRPVIGVLHMWPSAGRPICLDPVRGGYQIRAPHARLVALEDSPLGRRLAATYRVPALPLSLLVPFAAEHGAQRVRPLAREGRQQPMKAAKAPGEFRAWARPSGIPKGLWLAGLLAGMPLALATRLLGVAIQGAAVALRTIAKGVGYALAFSVEMFGWMGPIILPIAIGALAMTGWVALGDLVRWIGVDRVATWLTVARHALDLVRRVAGR